MKHNYVQHRIMMQGYLEMRNMKKGSITVEASIIVPIVILSISAVIYMGLLLYQRALIQSAAEMAAEAGASVWASGINEIQTGKPGADGFGKVGLYRRIFDSGKENRLETIRKYAADTAKKNELLHPVNSEVEVELKDYAVCRKLEVRIDHQYSLPLGSFLRVFGGSGMIKMSVKAVSSIDEPVELIRNTDFILDLEKKLEESNPELKNLGEKTRSAMNEIKEKVKDFLN